MPRIEGGESVLVSMGSNIAPAENLIAALRELADRAVVTSASRVYETDPVADQPMPAFLNAAVELRTRLEPVELKFQVLRPIESLLGRARASDRNAPRTIDLDIALFGDRVLTSGDGSIDIPDPEILTRAHVALPLADIAPDRMHPAVGISLASIAARFEHARGVRLVQEPERLRVFLGDPLGDPG